MHGGSPWKNRARLWASPDRVKGEACPTGKRGMQEFKHSVSGLKIHQPMPPKYAPATRATIARMTYRYLPSGENQEPIGFLAP